MPQVAMKKYVAAALAIGITIAPASAVDVGVGGKVGGVGLGAGVSAGSQGVSVGAGASADGVGGANVGASTSGSGPPGVGAGGNMGGIGAGVSAGARVGDHPSAQNGPAASARRPAAVTTAPALAKTAAQSISLPPVLRPSRAGNSDLRRVTDRLGPFSPLRAKPGTPAALVRDCRAAIMAAAKPLGAVRVYAASAGSLRQGRGGLNAPIEVRIDYERQGGIEVRQARVGCRLNAAGMVVAVI